MRRTAQAIANAMDALKNHQELAPKYNELKNMLRETGWEVATGRRIIIQNRFRLN